MKIKNERILASLVINAVIQHKKNLNDTLAQYIITPYVQELCFGTLRFYFKLQYYLDSLLKKKLPRKYILIERLILLGLHELTYSHTPAFAVTNEIVNAVKLLQPHQNWLASLTNAILRNYLRQKKIFAANSEKIPICRYAHPLWYIKHVKKSWPKFSSIILEANNNYPPLYLRVNQQKISRTKYLHLLNESNIEAVASPFYDWAIQLIKPCLPSQIPGFFQGLCSIQDVAAQYAASLLQLKPNQRILDACAAPGGKTSHILEINNQLEEVVAIDWNKQRCEKIKQNLQRLSLQAAIVHADATQTEQYWDGKYFDRILLDTPCSATGVIRRHPDIKLLRTQNDIIQFVNQQKKLLHCLWPLLKPNGLLLYVTCSILPEENENIIANFLSYQPNAVLELINLAIGHSLTYGHQILPGDANTDGFYYALLRRTA